MIANSRPVETSGVPSGYEYLMRSERGTDYHGKLSTTFGGAREVEAYRINARGERKHLLYRLDCESQKVALEGNGKGWLSVKPDTLGEALSDKFC